MERVRIEEFGELNDKIVNESILFSLGFLSQNSLWKLSTFCGYKGIYSRIREECEKSVFIQTKHFGDLVLRVG